MLEIQYIILGVLFLVSVYYLYNRFRKQFAAKKNDCGGSCGCSVAEKSAKNS